MIRNLYRCVVWLHPTSFRREFGEEMLWLFDEASENDGVLGLFADGFASLARQWLLRSGSWKVAVALALAVFQVTLGGLGQAVVLHRYPIFRSAAFTHIALSRNVTADIGTFAAITVPTIAGLLVAVSLLALWSRSFTGKRMHHLSRPARRA